MKKPIVTLVLAKCLCLGVYANDALTVNGSNGLFIGKDLVVHVDDDVNNLNTSTLSFESSGEPNLEFDGHFSNGTSATLTAGTGLLELTGSSSQNLDFGGDDLYNLEINNASGGVFTRTATVNNEVQFNSGDFTTTSSELLIFETSATSAGASDASHVNGPVEKNFNSITPFTFPVGHGSSYNPIGFSADNVGATTINAQYFFAQPTNRSNMGAGICKVSNVEYWDVTRTGASPEDGVVTLSWDAESDVSTFGDLLVAYWDGSDWQNGAGTAGANVIPSGSSMSSFNKYTLGSSICLNALPVELLEFTAKPMNNDAVDVNWITTSEINNDYFVVQRSKDGVNYSPIDSVDAYGNGNSIEQQSYGLLDYQPYSGISYYRLKQVDFDNTTSYSNIEIVNFEGLEIIGLYPNPSDGEINITIKSSQSGPVKLTIYDAIGKAVHYKEFEVIEGNTHISDETIQANGKYFISLATSDGKFYDHDVIMIK